MITTSGRIRNGGLFLVTDSLGRLTGRGEKVSEKMLTVPEVATGLRRSQRTIVYWLNAHADNPAEGLPGRKIGRSWLIPAKVIDDILAGRFELKIVSKKFKPTAAISPVAVNAE